LSTNMFRVILLSDPRKHECGPDLPGFPRPIESDQPTVQACHFATAGVAMARYRYPIP
jgi:hypothetical protein